MFDQDQLELFNGESYWREPPVRSRPVKPEPPDPPTTAQQLGWDNLQRGAIAHAEFETRMLRLGACPSRPITDPGGGVRSDSIAVAINGHAATFQVKSAVIDEYGRAEFKLGDREGTQTGKRDRRRNLPVIGRAEFFILAVFNKDSVITDWYVIPAKYLRLRVTLTVTPSRRSHRIRKGWLEPERFREGWERLLDLSTLLQESRSVLDSPPGEF